MLELLEFLGDDTDSDGDGLTFIEEARNGTNPRNKDTDDDAVIDGEEVKLGLNGYITDPLDVDTDDDGLWDGSEVNVAKTDPTDNDTDSDNLPDGWEVNYQMDPNDPDENNNMVPDSLDDFDGDSLINIIELQFKASPRDQDTDDDFMTDDYEVYGGGIGLQDPSSKWNETLLPGQSYFALHLKVAFNWSASENYIKSFISGMRNASKFLFGATDGYMLIGTITLYNDVNTGNPLWDNADVQVRSGNSNSASGGWLGITNNNEHVNLHQTYNNKQPTHQYYWKTIVHELGHYALGMFDEYYPSDGYGSRYPDNNNDSIRDAPPGIMMSQYVYSEFTTPTDYANWVRPAGYNDTHQHADPDHVWPYNSDTWVANPNAGESCWETFFRLYNSENGEMKAKMGGRNYQIEFDLDGNGRPDRTFKRTYRAVAGPADPDVSAHMIVIDLT
jgi:hypothetical protein